jgi:hypothetical protein
VDLTAYPFPIAWIDDLILWIWTFGTQGYNGQVLVGEKIVNYSKKYKNKTIKTMMSMRLRRKNTSMKKIYCWGSNDPQEILRERQQR